MMMPTPTESDRELDRWLRLELARGSRWTQPTPAAGRESPSRALARADFVARRRPGPLVRFWRWLVR
jgi:hypothetical protein